MSVNGNKINTWYTELISYITRKSNIVTLVLKEVQFIWNLYMTRQEKGDLLIQVAV